MDNREFAQVLLCEASSLLEGAQAEAYKARKTKEKENNSRIILDDPSNKRFPTTYNSKGEQQFHEPGDKAKHYYTGEIDSETGKRLYHNDDKDIEKNKEDHKRAAKVYNKVLAERERRHDAENEIISKYRKLKDQYGENVPGYDKLNKEYNKRKKNTNNMYGNNYLYALDATNRHIRRHSKKSQNESIAILLTEAALLLNEGARYRKEMKDVNGKSSKDYGKQAAKNIAKDVHMSGLCDMIDGAITNIDNKMILKDKENERLLKEILNKK